MSSAALGGGKEHTGRWLWALVVLVLGCFVLDLALGSVRILPGAVVKILLGQQAEPAAWSFIVRKIRLPKALTAILVGSWLAVSGLQMQTLFRNPLASPSVLGISAGVGLGVAALLLAGGSAASTYVIRHLGLGGS